MHWPGLGTPPVMLWADSVSAPAPGAPPLSFTLAWQCPSSQPPGLTSPGSFPWATGGLPRKLAPARRQGTCPSPAAAVCPEAPVHRRGSTLGGHGQRGTVCVSVVLCMCTAWWKRGHPAILSCLEKVTHNLLLPCPQRPQMLSRAPLGFILLDSGGGWGDSCQRLSGPADPGSGTGCLCGVRGRGPNQGKGHCRLGLATARVPAAL